MHSHSSANGVISHNTKTKNPWSISHYRFHFNYYTMDSRTLNLSLLDAMYLGNANGPQSGRAHRLPLRVTAHILRLEENFTPFHRLIKFLLWRKEQHNHGIMAVYRCVFPFLIIYLLIRWLAHSLRYLSN